MRTHTTIEESKYLYYKGLDSNTASFRYVTDDGKEWELYTKEYHAKPVSPSMEIMALIPCWTVGDLLDVISRARYQDSECNKIVIEPNRKKGENGIYIQTENGLTSRKVIDTETVHSMVILIDILIDADMLDDCVVESMRKVRKEKETDG